MVNSFFLTIAKYSIPLFSLKKRLIFKEFSPSSIVAKTTVVDKSEICLSRWVALRNFWLLLLKLDNAGGKDLGALMYISFTKSIPRLNKWDNVKNVWFLFQTHRFTWLPIKRKYRLKNSIDTAYQTTYIWANIKVVFGVALFSSRWDQFVLFQKSR